MDVGDIFWILVSDVNVKKIVDYVDHKLWPKASPTSYTCHQYILSLTSVTNIDVTVHSVFWTRLSNKASRSLSRDSILFGLSGLVSNCFLEYDHGESYSHWLVKKTWKDIDESDEPSDINTEIKINMRRSYVDQSYLPKLETSITKGKRSLIR